MGTLRGGDDNGPCFNLRSNGSQDAAERPHLKFVYCKVIEDEMRKQRPNKRMFTEIETKGKKAFFRFSR